MLTNSADKNGFLSCFRACVTHFGIEDGVDSVSHSLAELSDIYESTAQRAITINPLFGYQAAKSRRLLHLYHCLEDNTENGKYRRR